MEQQELAKMLDACINELDSAKQGECKPERAEKNAAMFLEMQLRLAEHISSAEFHAKMAKNEVERLSSQKYFEFRERAADKKMTEAALEHAITKDDDVHKVKTDVLKNEEEYKKWNYVIGVLGNGHIFFRNLGKREYGT